MNFVQCNLGAGVRLHMYETDQFKSVLWKIFIQQDLQREKAASTALIPLLLRRGSHKFPSTQQIARELEYLYAADFDSDVLKIGERQILEFSFKMINPSLLPNGEQSIERGLQTFWDIATNPAGTENSFLEGHFVKEKDNLGQQVKSLINNKRAYAFARAMAAMCAHEPFGIYKYGDEESIAGLQNEKVYAHYLSLWNDYPMDIFLVGSNLDVLANLFAKQIPKRQQVKKLPAAQAKAVEKPRLVEEVMPVQQAILIMGYRTNTTYLDSDYYPFLVGNGILGGFPHSKLFLNVREKESLAYHVGSNVEGTKGILTINAGIDGQKRHKAMEIIHKQLADLQQGLVSPTELEQTKKGIIAGIVGMRDNPEAIIDRNIIGIVNRELRSIEQVIQAVQAVATEDVVAAMNKLVLDTTYVLHSGGEVDEHGAN